MITIGKKIYSILKNNQAVSALIGSKIYPLIAPEGTPLPYVLYQRSYRGSGSKDGQVAGDIRVNFAVFAKTYLESIQIAQAIEQALVGYRDEKIKKINLEDGDEQYIEDAYLQAMVFTIKTAAV